MKGNIKHKDEVRHHVLVDAKLDTLRGKQALLNEWEQFGVYDSAYLKGLRAIINHKKAQLRAMGGME